LKGTISLFQELFRLPDAVKHRTIDELLAWVTGFEQGKVEDNYT
jgi:hypothetical protein